MFIADNFDWIFLAVLGVVSGFASGLLGIGGGLVIVPALIFALPFFDVSGPEIPKIAMATSLALVVPTSIASAQAHAVRGAVEWPMLGMLAPGIVIGAFVATLLFPLFNVQMVVLMFVIFAVVSSWRLLRGPEHDAPHIVADPTPSRLAITSAKGAAGGGIAAVLGIGGAFFILPMLLRFIPLHRAIGTTSALAIPLSLAGSAGYVLADAPSGCQQGCVGYIFFPAVAAIGICAVLSAPLGAWVTHRSPVMMLRRLFACFLILAAGNLAVKTLYPEMAMPPGTADIEVPSRDPGRAELARRTDPGIERRHPSPAPATGEPPEPAEPGPVHYPPPR